uniref:JmjC domain-containing protein n=1 Tax=Chromera velia CCMP2878 TaxID=1169474 RepID=A0A0G4FXV4_9ALVE|eukprot:Cvel_19331.t1-p1 / transcript=Cvel_19331.t1 / gene=Cvel_19331 / organism=Chromera_velia_CCMP2878 / gene_product=JmjC domain-containing protein 8, putative / transcript_product=JmjC domain-containing protein 8, putative / location=Cvel_scaffold1659:13754-16717(-) / protein_length=382 / sequence_SO=supercontig / SO=protein_coding / is_pseudo=false
MTSVWPVLLKYLSRNVALILLVSVFGEAASIEKLEHGEGWSSDPVYDILTVGIDRCDIPRLEIPFECVYKLGGLLSRETEREDSGDETAVPSSATSPGCGRKELHGLDPHHPPSTPVVFSVSPPKLLEGEENGASSKLPSFSDLTKKESLLKKYGDVEVILSTANTFSHEKVKKSFREYVDVHVSAEAKRGKEGLVDSLLNTPATDVLYKFGDNYMGWEDLLGKYERPQLYGGQEGALSFGVGGSGSGVPFHEHGAVFAEVFHGQKRWFFSPPDKEPQFEPDVTSFRWFHDHVQQSDKDGEAREETEGGMERRRQVAVEGEANEKRDAEGEDKGSVREWSLRLPPGVTTCTCRPGGEILWIPDRWWHATLNVGETVFLSDFV